MARIWTEGFERQSADIWNQGASGTWQSGSVFSTDANSRQANGSCTRGYYYNTCYHNFWVSYTELYLRICFKQSAIGIPFGIILQDEDNANAIQVYKNSSEYIELYLNDTLKVTGTIRCPYNEWHVLEIHAKLHDTTGIIENKVNGVADASWSGDTLVGTRTEFRRLVLTHQGANQVGWYDDFAVNDTTTGNDNSWCGDAHIYGIIPNANGDSSQWVGSDGNSTDNYLLVDELVPVTTDYVTSATSGNKDLYNLASIPTLPAGSVIKRVLVQVNAWEMSADGSSVQVGIKSGSTEDWKTVGPLTTSPANYIATEWLVNPDTSSAFSESEINSLQIGVKVP